MKKRLAALCFELPRPDAGEALPRTLTLLPAPDADGRVMGVDGRAWLLRDPVALADRFDRRRAITENHARVLVAPKGGRAPAFGWINAIRSDSSGAILFDPDWTPRGQAAIANRDYLYLSPEFEYDDAGNILAIVGAALTNDPNFPQLALNSEHDDPEHPMSLTAIAAALGLAETADEAACLTAINALRTERQTALNSAQHPDPTQYAPREELNVALNRATTAEAELATLRQAAAEAEIARVLDEAQAAGKVIPATRDIYLAICRRGGLDQFKRLVAAMPVIAAPTQLDQKPEQLGAGAEGLTPHQLAICAASGIAPKQYAESLKAAAA